MWATMVLLEAQLGQTWVVHGVILYIQSLIYLLNQVMSAFTHVPIMFSGYIHVTQTCGNHVALFQSIVHC